MSPIIELASGVINVNTTTPQNIGAAIPTGKKAIVLFAVWRNGAPDSDLSNGGPTAYRIVSGGEDIIRVPSNYAGDPGYLMGVVNGQFNSARIVPAGHYIQSQVDFAFGTTEECLITVLGLLVDA